VERATGAEAAASTRTGDTTAPLAITTNITTSTRYTTGNYIPVTKSDGILDKQFIDTATSYSWTAAHTFSTATTTLSATTSITGPIFNKDYDWGIFTAGEAINTGTSVMLSATDGKVYVASNDTVNASRFIGIAVQGTASGNVVMIARGGVISGVGFPTLTVGSAVYLGVSGVITQTAPSSNVVRVGIAKDSSSIYLLTRKLSAVKNGSFTCAAPDSATTTLGIRPRVGRVFATVNGDSGANDISMGFLVFTDGQGGAAASGGLDSTDTTDSSGNGTTMSLNYDNSAGTDRTATITGRITNTAFEIQISCGTYASEGSINYTMEAEE